MSPTSGAPVGKEGINGADDDVTRQEEERLLRDLQNQAITRNDDLPNPTSPVHTMTGSPRVILASFCNRLVEIDRNQF